MTDAAPAKPGLQVATPWLLILTLEDGVEFHDQPLLHFTASGVMASGGLLNMPVAVNLTLPPGKSCASALTGRTITDCNWRGLLQLTARKSSASNAGAFRADLLQVMRTRAIHHYQTPQGKTSLFSPYRRVKKRGGMGSWHASGG